MVKEIKSVFIHESDKWCLNEIGTGHSQKKTGIEQLRQTSGRSLKLELDLDNSEIMDMFDNCVPTSLPPGGSW